MSRIECISNRNIRIITSYLTSRYHNIDGLFNDLPYPSDRYDSAGAFFLNEDEWTTYDNFHRIFRRAKEISGEAYFYFNCGASSASLHSWGRFEHFAGYFEKPDDGFKRLPFFNSNINETKDIEIIRPPFYDRRSAKTRVILKVEYHENFDVDKDYISDPYRRGMVSAIPTVWGICPARIRQPLNPYDPEVLFNKEQEFISYGLDVRMEGDKLTVRDPLDAKRRIAGKRVFLEPELVNDKKVFLGRYTEPDRKRVKGEGNGKEAVLITHTIRSNGRILLKAGEIFRSPYFILDVTYDRLSLVRRTFQVLGAKRRHKNSDQHLVDTINGLRETIKARNRAYNELKVANSELEQSKKRLEEYNSTLERKVDERTMELRKAKDELLVLNQVLEARVNKQVEELNRYRDLRRYLSPKLAEKILTSGDTLGAEPRRKMMTVIFTDIRGFSTLTDSLEPEELFHLLDIYLSEMTKIIHHYEGTLNKITGDGMLIFFGDPVSMEDHARRSVIMAVDMQKKVFELKKEWLYYGYELGMGIGINTGYMTVGNIGSDMHMDYTVIGNQVNVAARLESLAKPGQILISQRTYSRVENLVEAEKVGKINVKGIHSPVMTYNVRVF